MIYLAIAILVGWLIYSWVIGVGLAVMCLVIALFYSAALSGDTQQKIIKAFSILVIVLSIVMIGAMNQRPNDTESDPPPPKMCGAVEC